MVLKELVSSSDVLSMAPWDVIAHDVQAGRLALLQLSELPLASSAYGIVSRAGHSLSPAAEQLLQLLREQDRDSEIPALPSP
jgi:DNA-binding transcriptional LysR family regulator